MATHSLTALDNGVCVAQALFVPSGTEVLVVAVIGASRYIDRTMPAAEARQTYKDLRAEGWTKPARTPILTARELRGHIYG